MGKPSPARRPRPVSRQRQAGEVTRAETRRRVLAAAAAEFAARGFTGATVARIAERADVAVPTVYSAWGSKRDLLRAVMASSVTEDEDGFDTGLDASRLLGPTNPNRARDAFAFLAHLGWCGVPAAWRTAAIAAESAATPAARFSSRCFTIGVTWLGSVGLKPSP